MKKLLATLITFVLCVSLLLVSCGINPDSSGDNTGDNGGNSGDNGGNSGNNGNTTVYSSGLEFISNNDGTCYVSGTGTCSDEKILIPPTSPSEDKVVRISTKAFVKHPMKSVVVPEGVLGIESEAFNECENLESVQISASVSSISSTAFVGCESITSFEIADGNRMYRSIDGNLYSKDGKTLITYFGNGDTSFTVPNSVKVIGAGAFYNCHTLESVVLPEGVVRIEEDAFWGATIKDINIPNSVEYIGYNAFFACNDLNYKVSGNGLYLGNSSNPYHVFITIPESTVTSIDIHRDTKLIGSLAFYMSEGISTITIPDGVVTICDRAFQYAPGLVKVTIPDSVKHIGANAFVGCSNLKNVVMGSGVESIGNYAFEGCSKLESIIIPGGVETIGACAFNGCTNLESATILDGVETIGACAFNGCTNLESVTIPDSVVIIGDDAFDGCDSLASITVKDNNKKFKSIEGILYSKDGKRLIKYAPGKTDENFTVPGTVEIIENAAFRDSNIVNLTISDSVKTIGDYAFERSEQLTNVVLGKNVENIGMGAFDYCDMLNYNTSYYDADKGVDVFLGADHLGTSDNPFYAIIRFNGLTIASSTFTTHPDTRIIAGGSYEHIEGYLLHTFLCENLVIGDSVEFIGERALYGSENLKNVKIGKGVKHIGTEAFASCINLESVDFDDEFVLNVINDWMFSGCESLKSVALPKSVQIIGVGAFSYCINLESVTLPDGVTDIGDWAFYGCIKYGFFTFYGNACYLGTSDNPYYALIMMQSEDAKTCTIHKDTKIIAQDAFNGCVSLTFELESGNTAFKLDKGSLYTKDGKRLISYAPTESSNHFTVPDTVEIIDVTAFRGNNSLVSVKFGENFKTIEMDAFADCKNLAEVLIGKNVETINYSIWTVPVRINIFYEGTEADWNKISISDYGREAFAKAFMYYYSSDVPPVASNWWHYEDGKVTLWGDTVASQGLEFISNGDGTCYVYGIGECKDTTVVIPWISPDGDIVTSLGYGAFLNCSTIEKIVIPSSVTKIGEKAFYGCSKLKEIKVNEENEYYKSVNGNLYTKDGKTLVVYATGKTDTKFTVPNTVEVIAASAFYDQKTLTSVIIQDSVTTVSASAFKGCTSLTEVHIGNGVTSIGESAFSGCSKLAEIHIGKSVKEISGFAFKGCSSLKSVYYSSDDNVVAAWCNISFEEHNLFESHIYSNPLEYAKELYLNGKLVTYVTIPDGVKKIPDFAFSCNSITSVTIPDTVEVIGEYAFANCANLVSVSIPYGVKVIGEYAFANCVSLTKVTIPDSVSVINKCTFFACEALEYVDLGASVDHIGSGAFEGCHNLYTLVVPVTLDHLEKGAFYNSLHSNIEVFYKGTVDDRLENLSGANLGEDNRDFDFAKWYYYSESEPTTTGNYWHYVNGKIVKW